MIAQDPTPRPRVTRSVITIGLDLSRPAPARDRWVPAHHVHCENRQGLVGQPLGVLSAGPRRGAGITLLLREPDGVRAVGAHDV